MKRVHAPGGNKTFETIYSKKRPKSSRGMFAYDSISVSYARELTSVSMRYSQGDGFNTSLSRFIYYAYASLLLDMSIKDSVFLCVGCGYLPWHGHVLPGTKVIKIMCGHQLYEQG